LPFGLNSQLENEALTNFLGNIVMAFFEAELKGGKLAKKFAKTFFAILTNRQNETIRYKLFRFETLFCFERNEKEKKAILLLLKQNEKSALLRIRSLCN